MQAKNLSSSRGGQMKPLKDDQKIVIKGGEVFVSHVRTGSSA